MSQYHIQPHEMSCGNRIYIPPVQATLQNILYTAGPPTWPYQGLPIPSPSLALKDTELDEEVDHPAG